MRRWFCVAASAPSTQSSRHRRGTAACSQHTKSSHHSPSTSLPPHNRFDNLALRALPVEDGPRTTPRPVPGACFSRAEIQPLAAPRVVAVSDEALALIGLDPSEAEARPDAFAAFFGGCQALPGAEPAAHCYCGHQFGSFAGQLGVSQRCVPARVFPVLRGGRCAHTHHHNRQTNQTNANPLQCTR